MRDKTRQLAVKHLIEPWIVLRPVQRESVEYLEMRDSIADKGFLNSICVRPSQRQGFYDIVDGLWRWTVAKELKLTTMPCIIKSNLTDDDMAALQIQANSIRPETTPLEFARQLRKIVDARPLITLAQLQAIVHKNPTWINRHLDLLDLTPGNQKRLERGEISLDNAMSLAQIPYRHQSRYTPLAMTLPNSEFRILVSAYMKKYREAAIQGTLDVAELNGFELTPYCRSVKELRQEETTCNIGAIAVVGLSPLAAWRCCLQWVMHLDAESAAIQKEKFSLRKYTAVLKRKVDDAIDYPCLPRHLDPCFLNPVS